MPGGFEHRLRATAPAASAVDSGLGISSSASGHARGLRGLADRRRGCVPPRRGCCPRGVGRRHAEVQDQRGGTAPPTASSGPGDRLGHRLLAPAFVARTAIEQRLAPAAVLERDSGRRVHRRAALSRVSSSHSASCRPPRADRGSRSACAWRRPRRRRSRAPRPRRDAPDRAARRETGAWRYRMASSNPDSNPASSTQVNRGQPSSATIPASSSRSRPKRR